MAKRTRGAQRDFWGVGAGLELSSSGNFRFDEASYQAFAVDDEARALCYLVVEFDGCGVGFVGEPVDSGGVCEFCLPVDGFNQGVADAFSAG